MEKQEKKRYVKLWLKVSLSLVAIYIVFQKIDADVALSSLKKAHPVWLFAGLICFNLSKIVSASRQNALLKDIGVLISSLNNLKLYYTGMFYNLFLPGGIGGDGYKIFYLKKIHQNSSWAIFRAVLLDRISGMAALAFLLFILLTISEKQQFPTYIVIATGMGAGLVYPIYFIMLKLAFKSFTSSFLQTSLLSIFTQLLQLCCAYCLLMALGIFENHLAYLVLFLASSVVAIIPITIGGVGAREMTFLLATPYFSIDTNTAVIFSLVFFIITAISSFFGAFIKLESVHKFESSFK